MPKKPKKQSGILFLEAEFSSTFKEDISIRHMSEMLQMFGTPTVHRTIRNRQGFADCIRDWMRAKNYPILYFVGHGKPGKVYLDRRHKECVDLPYFTEVLNSRKILGNRLIYFGSCATFRNPSAVERMINGTDRLIGLCGYRNYVDYIEAASYELITLRDLSLIHPLTRGKLEKFFQRTEGWLGPLGDRLGAEHWL